MWIGYKLHTTAKRERACSAGIDPQSRSDRAHGLAADFIEVDGIVNCCQRPQNALLALKVRTGRKCGAYDGAIRILKVQIEGRESTVEHNESRRPAWYRMVGEKPPDHIVPISYSSFHDVVRRQEQARILHCPRCKDRELRLCPKPVSRQRCDV